MGRIVNVKKTPQKVNIPDKEKEIIYSIQTEGEENTVLQHDLFLTTVIYTTGHFVDILCGFGIEKDVEMVCRNNAVVNEGFGGIKTTDGKYYVYEEHNTEIVKVFQVDGLKDIAEYMFDYEDAVILQEVVFTILKMEEN